MGRFLTLFKGKGGSGAVEPYSPDGPGSALSGGRRRRRSLRRTKRKGSRKRSRRHRGGKSQQEQEQEQEQEDQEETSSENSDGDDETKGGRRRRKGSRGKKTRGKTRGKASAWIKHVLQFAKDNKMKYGQALKDKRCRSAYKSQKK